MVQIADLQSFHIEAIDVIPKGLIIPLLDSKEGIEHPLLLSVTLEVSNAESAELLERMDSACLKPNIPHLDRCLKSGEEGFAHHRVCSPLEHHTRAL